MTPVLSIIIPCHNHGKYLEEAIDSIEQYPEKSIYEIIIINDGSTEKNTVEILDSLKKKGYTVIDQENKGLSTARNNGIAISKGKYILPLDADNKIRPVYIKKGISILDSIAAIGIVYGDTLHFGDQNEVFKAGKFSLRRLLVRNFIDACIIMRKEVWQMANGYDGNLTALEDWDMNLSAAATGWQFHYIPEIMFDYRIRKDSMIRVHPDLQKCRDYIAKKHGALYREEFLKTIRIKTRIPLLLKDIWQKLLGRTNF